jgi:hypothetical protein
MRHRAQPTPSYLGGPRSVVGVHRTRRPVTTVLSERLRRATRSPDSAPSSSRSSEASGPTPRATESYSELAAGALGRGPGVTPSARNGPLALNFKIPAVTRLVSRAPRL